MDHLRPRRSVDPPPGGLGVIVPSSNDDGAVLAAIRDLLAGRVIGLPTDTVYGLAAALDRPGAIADLFAIKGRSEGKPLPVLIAGTGALGLVARPVPARVAAFLAALWPGGLTVALPARAGLSPAVVAPDGTVGIRVPDHGLTVAVLRGAGGAAAVTSANRSGAPPLRTASEVRAAFGSWLGVVLDGEGRADALPSTVIGFDGDEMSIIRHGAIGEDLLRAAWDPAGRESVPRVVSTRPGTVR
ncbi:MAG: L-threonylcarbamoyladenylate synthase [Chloroflexota bacterium]|nr:L-threonylcarbamoyladenylate synthase [Chloroflexota bacterium]